MKKLDASYSPIVCNMLQSQKSVRPVVDENNNGNNTGTIETEESVTADVLKSLLDVAQMVSDIDLVDPSKPQYVEPDKFEEAWNHQDPIYQE